MLRKSINSSCTNVVTYVWRHMIYKPSSVYSKNKSVAIIFVCF